jgi:hypothetical protein
MRYIALSMALVSLVGCGGQINKTGNGTRADAGGMTVPIACEPNLVEAGAASGSDAGVPQNHRSTAACCPAQRGPGPSGQPYQTCSGPAGTQCPANMASTCASDSECTTGVNGRCFPWEGLVGPGGCSYDECFTDSHCGSKTPCLCRSSAADNNANVCDVGGNCAVDSDCGPWEYCSPSVPFQDPNICWGLALYYCHTATDQCLNDSDCNPPDAGLALPDNPGYGCAYNPQDTRWECVKNVCALP